MRRRLIQTIILLSICAFLFPFAKDKTSSRIQKTESRTEVMTPVYSVSTFGFVRAEGFTPVISAPKPKATTAIIVKPKEELSAKEEVPTKAEIKVTEGEIYVRKNITENLCKSGRKSSP